MAIFRQFTYTNTGTEIEFMQGLIDLICGLDDGITCEDTDGNPTTAAEQYADLTSASKATFVFNFGNGVKTKFQRHFTNNQGAQSFDVFYNTNVSSSYNTSWANVNSGVTQETTRSYFVSYLKSENLFVLWFGNWTITAISNATYSAIILKTSDDMFVTTINSANIINQTLVGTDTSVIYSPLFQYAREAGKIDFADHAPFVSGGVKLFDTEEILSCSTVSQWATITLPGRGNYFAIGTNALVPIDDE